MRNAALVTRWIVRLTGLVQIALGLAFWTGHGLSLIPLHMMNGFLVSLGLAVLAVLAWRTGSGGGVAVLGIAWALVLPAFGIVHVGMLPGSWHWIVRVVHLALGLGALGFADRLAELTLRRTDTRAATAAAS